MRACICVCAVMCKERESELMDVFREELLSVVPLKLDAL